MEGWLCLFDDHQIYGKTPDKKIRRNAYTYILRDAEAEIISKPKKGYERRNIHITHPIPAGAFGS